MALDYLGSVTGNGGAEVKGLDYVNNLAMRSLFHEIKKSDGDVKWFKMHDIVHDFALFLRKNNVGVEAVEMAKRSCQVPGSSLVSQAQEDRSLLRESPMDLCDQLTSLRVLDYEVLLCGTPKGMDKLIHLRWLALSYNILTKKHLKIICKLYFLQTLLLYYCLLEEIPGEIGNLVHLTYLDLSNNYGLKELPESMCSLVELRLLNLRDCRNLHRLPDGIHALQNLRHLLVDSFHVGSHFNKLKLLRNLNCLAGYQRLEIHIDSTYDLAEDAREAGLRNKIDLQTLEVIFKNNEEEHSSPATSLWEEVIEALEPHHNLNFLTIRGYEGSELPDWISSPFYLVKKIILRDFSELLLLPPMRKLPFLEILEMQELKELKKVGREFSGMESSSSSSNDALVAFPKLKELTFVDCDKWEKWEDITTEEAREECVLMPSLTKLKIHQCRGLKKLPHNLLRKASSSLRILNIKSSSELQNTYADENGSPWKSISENNPQLRLQQ